MAIVLVALSTFLRVQYAPYFHQLLFFTYFPAILAAGWFGGFGPGVLATLLGSLCVAYFLADRPFSFAFDSIDLIRFLVFVSSGLFVSGLNGILHLLLRHETAEKERYREAEQELRVERAKLEERSAALEQTVEERTAELRGHVAHLEEFSYTVSHDLRSPLRAMEGYATAVLEDYGHSLDAQGQGYLRQIIKAAQRMDLLTRDVLAYSKVTRESVSLGPLELEALIRDILDHFPQIKAAQAEVILRSPLHPVLAQESLLSQALSNLIGNALKFVPAGTTPRIEISSQLRSDKVRLAITDNGIGVAPEHQARLFGLFERINPSGPFEGTGIGLAIVRKAAERMGGRAGLESDGKTGSTFWIELGAAPRR